MGTYRQLLEEACSNPDRFSELYNHNADAIYGYIFKRIENIEESQDLTEIVWEKIFMYLPELKEKTEKGFRAWMYKIAYNAISDHIRKIQRRPEIDTNLDVYELKTEDLSLPPDKEYEVKTLFLQAIKLIRRLPKKQSEVIDLRYLQELSNKEISKILNISEKTVASNLVRGLQKLRKLMQ